jgi:hypothetical protein
VEERGNLERALDVYHLLDRPAGVPVPLQFPFEDLRATGPQLPGATCVDLVDLAEGSGSIRGEAHAHGNAGEFEPEVGHRGAEALAGEHPLFRVVDDAVTEEVPGVDHDCRAAKWH